jgi:hypothetical protein
MTTKSEPQKIFKGTLYKEERAKCSKEKTGRNKFH